MNADICRQVVASLLLYVNTYCSLLQRAELPYVQYEYVYMWDMSYVIDSAADGKCGRAFRWFPQDPTLTVSHFY